MKKLYPILALLFLSCFFFSCEKEEVEKKENFIETQDYKIIAGFAPEEGAPANQFTIPYVLLNYLPDQIIEVEGKKYKPSITISKFESDKDEIAYDKLYKGDTLFLIPYSEHYVSPRGDVAISIKAYWSYSEDGQEWSILKDEEGINISEEEEISYSPSFLYGASSLYITGPHQRSDHNDGYNEYTGLPFFTFKSELFQFEDKNLRIDYSLSITSANDSVKYYSFKDGKDKVIFIPTSSFNMDELYKVELLATLSYYNQKEWVIAEDRTVNTSWKFYYSGNDKILNAESIVENPTEVDIFYKPSISLSRELKQISERIRPAVEASVVQIDNGDVYEGKLLPDPLNPKENIFFELNTPLNELKEHKVTFIGYWEYLENNEWKKIPNFELQEEASANFKTAEMPVRIPMSNVAYSYPLDHQFHFLKDEHPNGYLKMRFPQQKVLDKINSSTLRVLIQPLPKSGTSFLTSNLSYDVNEAKFTYALPKGLENETIYELSFLAINSEVDTIYKSHFRTSMFNTFPEKANAWERNEGWIRPLSNAYEVGQTIFGPEFLDNYEESELLQVEVITDTLSNFNDYVKPAIYTSYANLPVTIRWRDINSKGLIPTTAAYMRFGSRVLLTDQDIKAGNASTIEGQAATMFDFFSYVEKDYKDLASQIQNTEHEETESGKAILALQDVTFFPAGDYPFKMSYVLPGMTEPNSSVTLTVNKVWD